MDLPEQSMDPAMYIAAVQGKIDPFESCETSLNQLLTPNKNTILHVYLENQSVVPKFPYFINRILDMCPSLLSQPNAEGETLIHFAARYGHAHVAKVLIDHAKTIPFDTESETSEALKMLRMKNVEKDTALHVAAQNLQSSVVNVLTEADSEFLYSANAYGETPLYLVTNNSTLSWFRGTKYREEVIDIILKKCKLVDYSGPNGRTALHAAVMRNDHETVKKILTREQKLTKAVDKNGWSPLHYAAYLNRHSLAKLLLQHDVSATYIVATDQKITALHIAALQGNLKVMNAIVSACPTCCELVDNKGWNAIHYLLASGRYNAISISGLQMSKLRRLIYKKDYEGNSPLHLLAAFGKVAWFIGLPPAYWKMTESGVNKDGLSVDDILNGNFHEKKKKILKPFTDIEDGPHGSIVVRKFEDRSNEALEKATKSHLVAAVLIATVTFAAAFTLPGGYRNEQGPHQGSAILSKNAAFIAFVISDAMSMVLSLSAVFIHFLMAPFTPRKRIYAAASAELILFAMYAMVIAFATGTYAVLAPSPGLAITTCLIGLSFFVFLNVLSLTLRV